MSLNSRLAETRRYGFPRTGEERAARHEMLYGNRNLPPRGTGRIADGYSEHLVKSILGGIGFGVGVFILYKVSKGKLDLGGISS